MNNDTADNFVDSTQDHTGLHETWFTRTKNEPTRQKTRIVQRRREVRTKAQIIEPVRNQVQQSLKNDAKMRKIASQVYAAQHAQSMLQLSAERASTAGGFFPQVGVNLIAQSGERRLTRVYDMGCPTEETREEQNNAFVGRVGSMRGLRQRKRRQSDSTQTRRTLHPEFMDPDDRTFSIPSEKIRISKLFRTALSFIL